ncbi:MAG TPA: hypothetical protein DER60_01405 [Syntrophomonas sp.]|jgi:hypothetical protein|nr:hypothetical protein [Syntrophomonas sp.]
MCIRTSISKKLSLILVLCFITSFLIPAGNVHAGESLTNSAIQFIKDDFMNDGMVNSDNGVGSYALYVLAEAGVAVGEWEYDGEAFPDLVCDAVEDDISKAADPSEPTLAKLLSQDLAAALALERDDLAEDLVEKLAARQTETGFDSSLFSNVPAFDLLGRLGFINEINTGQARDYILGQQNITTAANDIYSWGFVYGGDYYPDFIATAQAVRSLHYLDPDGEDDTVQEAINNALEWMENQQQADGSFVPAGGVPGMDDPLINACEAIVTLHTLNMDPDSWSSAGNSALDYLENDGRNDDGSFGAGRNIMDATAFLFAYSLVMEAEDELYIDPANPTLEVDETVQLQAKYVSGGNTTDVTADAAWSVDDDTVAAVDGGLLTALQEGQTTVTAAYNGYEASATVTVEASAASCTVSMAVVGPAGELMFKLNDFSVEASNPRGLTAWGALDASGVEYTYANWPSYGDYVDSIGGVASSGSSGWMYATNDQTIYALPDSCDIYDGDKIVWYYSAGGMGQSGPAWEEITGLTVDPFSTSISVGGSQQLKALYHSGGQTTDVTADAVWSMEDDGFASVVNGLLSGLEAGQTAAKAEYNGYQAYCDVTVTASPPGGGGGGGETGVSVHMAVVDQSGELLYGPNEFTVSKSNPWGLTVMGALDASGADYTTGTWAWGEYVNSIEGVANSGEGGWMFAVNGTPATRVAEEQEIDEGDKIIWYYATGMGEQPPAWSDLVDLQKSGGQNVVEAEAAEVISDEAVDAAIRNANNTGQVVLQADEGQESLALSREQLARISALGKPLVVKVQGMQFILSPDSLKIPVFTDAGTAAVVFKAHKLSPWAIENQVAPFESNLKLAGDIYELEVLVQQSDQTRQEVESIPGARLILPVMAGFQETAGEGRVMAYRYNETSQTWEYLGGEYDAASQSIGLDTSHFSKYALLLSTASFDDINGHWAQKIIEFMAANGYVSGMGNGMFLPDAQITRAEFVTIVTRLAGLKAQSEAQLSFTDVSADAWYREAVDIAVSNGIVLGIDDKTFAPNDPVSREQMAAIMVRLLEKQGKTLAINEDEAGQALSGITDRDSISSWARLAVAAIVQEKIMEGRDGGCFAPRDYATRAEATTVLYKVLQVLL